MNQPTVFLVEEDTETRGSTTWMFRNVDIPVRSFSDPQHFLDNYDVEVPGCLLLDLNFSNVHGVLVTEEIASVGYCPPFILMSENFKASDIKRLMSCGASDFMQKPVNSRLLICKVRAAFEEDEKRRSQQTALAEVRQRIDSLSTRERQVLSLIMEGKLSKQIAAKLSISIKTVEAHRSNLIRKMQVDTIVQVVCLVAEVQFSNNDSAPISWGGPF